MEHHLIKWNRDHTAISQPDLKMDNNTSTDVFFQNLNRIISELIVDGYIESFGIWHQVFFIDFDFNGEANRLSFNCFTRINQKDKQLDMTEAEHTLLCLYKIKSLRALEANCNDRGELHIKFDDNIHFQLIPNPLDEFDEPWQLTDGVPHEQGGRTIIASSHGGYAVW